MVNRVKGFSQINEDGHAVMPGVNGAYDIIKHLERGRDTPVARSEARLR